MKLRQLGNTDLRVSELCLGTMTWGQQNNEQDGFQQMDLAHEHGINFFDTAEMYAVPPTAESYGTTEIIIGKWLNKTKQRNNIILASKVCGQANWLPHVRDGYPRLNRPHIEQAINDSLKRLQTDYLDLYQLHWPDRNTNYFGKLGYQHNNEDSTPILETLEVLSDLVKAGKIRHIGLSNETPWGTMKFMQLAEQQQLPRAVSVQNPYNLLNRSYEIGMAEVSHRENIGLLAYSPLAFGVLSGKYLNNQWPEGARITLFKRFSRYTNPQAVAATEKYIAIAEKHNIDPCQMALQFVTQQPFVTSNIIGATSIAQLKNNLDSTQLTLTDDLLEELEQVHTEHSNPAP